MDGRPEKEQDMKGKEGGTTERILKQVVLWRCR